MISIFLAIFGVIFGSFLNVLILRTPQGKSISFPSSHCYSCNTSLKWYHNIPLLSWCFLRGKCAFCKDKISFQYPLIELICGILFFICSLKETEIFVMIVTGIIFSLLLALSIIDFRYKAVPDIISIPALLLVFIHPDFSERIEYALMFAGGFALLKIVVSSIIKKEAMGEADIIIAAIIGGMLGISQGLMAIYLSALLALPAFIIVSKKNFELPFIPFLAMGLFVVYFLSDYFSQLVKYIYG